MQSQIIWIHLTSISFWQTRWFGPKLNRILLISKNAVENIFSSHFFTQWAVKKSRWFWKSSKCLAIFRWDLKKLSTLIFQSNTISKKQLWIGVWWCQFNPTTNLGSFLLGHQKWLRCWFLSILGKKIGLYFVSLARHFSLGL